jgi:CRP-like cAMP-binding protein
MAEGALGKDFSDGDIICRQGELGDRMFIIQAGRAVVLHTHKGAEKVVGVLGPGEVFGEMSIFEKQPRSATVRAKGATRVLTLDKKWFLKQIQKDPSLAWRVMEQMSRRIRNLDAEVTWLLVHANRETPMEGISPPGNDPA